MHTRLHTGRRPKEYRAEGGYSDVQRRSPGTAEIDAYRKRWVRLCRTRVVSLCNMASHHDASGCEAVGSLPTFYLSRWLSKRFLSDAFVGFGGFVPLIHASRCWIGGMRFHRRGAEVAEECKAGACCPPRLRGEHRLDLIETEPVSLRRFFGSGSFWNFWELSPVAAAAAVEPAVIIDLSKSAPPPLYPLASTKSTLIRNMFRANRIGMQPTQECFFARLFFILRVFGLSSALRSATKSTAPRHP